MRSGRMRSRCVRDGVRAKRRRAKQSVRDGSRMRECAHGRRRSRRHSSGHGRSVLGVRRARRGTRYRRRCCLGRSTRNGASCRRARGGDECHAVGRRRQRRGTTVRDDEKSRCDERMQSGRDGEAASDGVRRQGRGSDDVRHPPASVTATRPTFSRPAARRPASTRTTAPYATPLSARRKTPPSRASARADRIGASRSAATRASSM